MLSILGRHIDALYLSVSFEFPLYLKEILDEGKKQAQENESDLALLRENIMGVPGGPWYVKAHGHGKYQYVMENASFWMALTTWKNLPSVQLQFKAGTLYEYEPEQYSRIVDYLIRGLIGPKLCYSVKVSRCDLAVDFQEQGFKLPDMADVVTRARDRVVNYKGDRPNTLTLGKRHGTLQAQVYCKSEELLVSDKAWMYEVWRASGEFREDLPVWRAELRYYREALRSFEVDTLDDVLASLGDLAMYTVGDEGSSWLRIADPRTRGKQVQTRGSAGWWSAVSGALRDGLLSSGRKRKGYDPRPSYTRCIELAGAHLARAASIARLGGYRLPLSCETFSVIAAEKYEGMLGRKGMTWADKVNSKTAELRGIAWIPKPVNLLAV